MRLFTILFCYGMGFLTAVYVLSPAPAVSGGSAGGLVCKASAHTPSTAQPTDRAAKLRVGLDKALSFAEENAKRLGQQMKDWLSQNAQSDPKTR